MQSEKKQIVVIGASRGIGAAVARHFVSKGDRVFSISRNQPVAGESTIEWILTLSNTVDVGDINIQQKI